MTTHLIDCSGKRRLQQDKRESRDPQGGFINTKDLIHRVSLICERNPIVPRRLGLACGKRPLATKINCIIIN